MKVQKKSKYAFHASTLLVSAGLFAVSTGCENAGQGALSGAAIGATAGAIIGSTQGEVGKGAAIGAAVGGASGAVVGDQNRRRNEREQQNAYNSQKEDG